MVTLATEIAEPLGRASAVGFTIRAAQLCDVPGLATHFSEMQAHYRRPVSMQAAVAAAEVACRPRLHDFDPHVLLALTDQGVVGSIVMNVSFPAFELSRSLYIRDLYVARTMRRTGVGSALVTAAAKLALHEGFSALEWTTDSGNAAARSMYESCGATLLERTYYRLFDDSLRVAGTK